ncbi:MAG: glycosyltransferase [Planctomycetes bacterium]|nr:glycosyltransferase [Planctomycetota bacterium]
MTRVSVLLPAFHHARFLDEALRSVLGQTHRELELLVLDDGSTDDTARVLARAASDPRVRLFRHHSNLGVSRSLNDLLAEARGEWVAFQNADDAWYPGHLEDALAHLEASRADLSWAPCDLVDAAGRPHPEASALAPRLWGTRPRAADVHGDLLAGNFIPSHSVVLRASVLRAVGRFDERLELLHDWDLWLRVAADHTVARSGRAAGVFRWHGANRSAPGAASREHYALERAVVYGRQSGLGGPRGAEACRRYASALHRLGNRLDGRLAHPAVRAVYAEASRARPGSLELALKRRLAGRHGDRDPDLEALLARYGFGGGGPPTLTVCAITRDRDRELEGWLANVRDLADEALVVDGAASEATRRLCEEAGARYLERPWPRNYAVQKNAALAAARTDWVLFLDTDERVGDRLRARLPRLLAAGGVDCWRLPMYWVASLDPLDHVVTRKHYPCRVPRLFRRTPRLHYDERLAVHERVPRPVRGRMRRLRGAHLFHLAFVLHDEAALARKAAGYAELAPGSAATTARYYRWREVPHRVRRCREGFRG